MLRRCSMSVALAVAVVAHAAVIDLKAANAEEEMQEGQWFIKFYAPWCGHCKKLSPVWNEIAESQELKAGVRIGRVDCTRETALRTKYAISGYPTLLFFDITPVVNGTKIYKFTGPRNSDTLLAFANGGWKDAKIYDPADQPPPKPRKTFGERIEAIFSPIAGLIGRNWKLILFVYALIAVFVLYKFRQQSSRTKALNEASRDTSVDDDEEYTDEYDENGRYVGRLYKPSTDGADAAAAADAADGDAEPPAGGKPHDD